MELKEFIKKALAEIYTGIKDAQDEVTKEHPNTYINPTSSSLDGYTGQMNETSKFDLRQVEFDIAIETSSAKEYAGKLNIAGTLVGGADKKKSEKNVSRVKFTLPVLMPYQIFQHGQEKESD